MDCEKERRLEAAERLLDRAWVAKHSFQYGPDVTIYHPFFSSGWVARNSSVVLGKEGTTVPEALQECDTHQFNGFGFDSPIDAYLAAVDAGLIN